MQLWMVTELALDINLTPPRVTCEESLNWGLSRDIAQPWEIAKKKSV